MSSAASMASVEMSNWPAALFKRRRRHTEVLNGTLALSLPEKQLDGAKLFVRL
jgi:hypothetical protein